MATTRTGSLPIGFRRGWGAWQKDLANVISFCKNNDFASLDVGALPTDQLKQIVDAGLTIGSVDMQAWGDLIHQDAQKRQQAAEVNIKAMRDAAALGVQNFFIVLTPADPTQPRLKNFEFAVDSLKQIAQGVAGTGARVAIEGWPGGAPYHASLCCTPADYRALLKELPESFGGVNFDPSHLIRLGIDPVRFAEEFASRVVHLHGKDTELLDDELYEHGNLQPATFAKPHVMGGHHWRYCIPGHGVARWSRMLKVLVDAGYKGVIAIELEDENFNGTDDGEQRGLIAARDFLAHA